MSRGRAAARRARARAACRAGGGARRSARRRRLGPWPAAPRPPPGGRAWPRGWWWPRRRRGRGCSSARACQVERACWPTGRRIMADSMRREATASTRAHRSRSSWKRPVDHQQRTVSRSAGQRAIVGRLTTMAFVVPRGGSRWELREAAVTARGPRSSTLATFGELTPEVARHACRRSRRGLTERAALDAARRAGAPVRTDPAAEAASALLAEISAGRRLARPLARLLVDAIGADVDRPSDPERAAAPWLAATLDERGEALRDLLLLADRLPVPPRHGGSSFPRIASSAA